MYRLCPCLVGHTPPSGIAWSKSRTWSKGSAAGASAEFYPPQLLWEWHSAGMQLTRISAISAPSCGSPRWGLQLGFLGLFWWLLMHPRHLLWLTSRLQRRLWVSYSLRLDWQAHSLGRSHSSLFVFSVSYICFQLPQFKLVSLQFCRALPRLAPLAGWIRSQWSIRSDWMTGSASKRPDSCSWSGSLGRRIRAFEWRMCGHSSQEVGRFAW